MSAKYYPVIDMSATGKNITVLRKARGLSVADLQKYFGFEAPQAIYKWQRGETLPSTDNLLALGFILEVPIESILVFQTIKQNEPQDNSCGFGLFGTQISSPLSPKSEPESKPSPTSKLPKLSISSSPGFSSFSKGFPCIQAFRPIRISWSR